jgi:hypothetical protein
VAVEAGGARTGQDRAAHPFRDLLVADQPAVCAHADRRDCVISVGW